MLHSSAASAGVWTTDLTLGLSGEYSTNPALLNAAHTAETHGAVLIDSPTTFNGNAMKFFVDPSFRISDSSGYSSIASDYAHLVVGGEFDTERDTVSFNGQIDRDSSLYYNYSVNGSTGVRRDTTLADATWTRALTERVKFNLDISPSRVLYGSALGFGTLTDYRYTSATPSVVWYTSERATLSLIGGAGLYDSLDGRTKSSNSQLQVGFSRQISELWTVTGNAGYSRQSNQAAEYFESYLLETIKSTTSGTIFSANVARQSELLQVTAAASRKVVPTGFAYLARQDSYELDFNYQSTPRWTFGGHVRRIKSVEPQLLGPTAGQSYFDYGLSANRLLTEFWTFNIGASRITARYMPPPVNVAASGISVQITRKFNRIVWH